jgi:hypothetical protein
VTDVRNENRADVRNDKLLDVRDIKRRMFGTKIDRCSEHKMMDGRNEFWCMFCNLLLLRQNV